MEISLSHLLRGGREEISWLLKDSQGVGNVPPKKSAKGHSLDAIPRTFILFTPNLVTGIVIEIFMFSPHNDPAPKKKKMLKFPKFNTQTFRKKESIHRKKHKKK